MVLIDSHTHLNDPKLFENRESYVTQFVDKGGTDMVNVGASPVYNLNAIHIAQKWEQKPLGCNIYASVGLHPYEVVASETSESSLQADIEDIVKLVETNRKYIVAIGECGIDLHYPWSESTLKLQQTLFEKQCELAQKLELPLIIHSRDAFDETMQILEWFKNLKIYFHCRGYWIDEITLVQEKFKKLRIWFCGNVTYKNANKLRDSLNAVDINNLLLETDAPYLAAQAVRWQTNHPALISHLYDFVAEYLWINMLELQKITKNNFIWLYKQNQPMHDPK